MTPPPSHSLQLSHVSRLFRDGAGEGGAGASKAAQIAEVDYLETGEAMARSGLVHPR